MGREYIGPFGRLFHCFFGMIAVMAVLCVFSGCQGSGASLSPGSATASDGYGGFGPTHHFAREVNLQFYDPLNKRVVSSPFADVTDVELEKLRSLQEVRSQTNEFPFEQVIGRGQYDVKVNLLQDEEIGHEVGFAARTIDDPVFKGVVHYGQGATDGPVSYTVQLPPPEDESDVNNTLVKVGLSEHIPVEGNQIVVRFAYNGSNWQCTINGEVVEEWNENGGGWFYAPVVKSTQAGIHTVTYHAERYGNQREYTYYQRRLSFQQEFPEYPEEPEDLSSPVEIENSFAWSDGAVVENPRWSIQNERDEEAQKSGLSTSIQATWDPVAEVLTQTTEEIPAEERFQKVPFVVKASADAYSSNTRYEISSDMELPGELEYKIIPQGVTPEDAFEEEGSDSATVKADIAIFDSALSESDMTWTVSIESPDGDREELSTGEGVVIEGTWDGTFQDQAVPNPKEFTFFIEATYCEMPPDIILRGNEVRGQFEVPTGDCPDDAYQFARVAINLPLPVSISKIRFDTNASSNGPFPAYDWKADAVRGILTSPTDGQWTGAGKNVPVLFKKGTSILIKAEMPNARLAGPLKDTESIRIGLTALNVGLPPKKVGEVTLHSADLLPENFHNGKLSFPYQLPNTVGRHRLRFSWDLEFLNASGSTITTTTLTTPLNSDEAHMLYTVLEERVEFDIAGIDIMGHPAHEAWYNSDTFQVSNSEAKKLNSLSPLDQATALAEGATTPKEAVTELIRRFYLESGGSYMASTNASDLRAGSNQIYLKWYLGTYLPRNGPKIECPQTATYLQILLGYLGVRGSTLDLLPGGVADQGTPYPKIWTNYIRPIGPGGRGSFTSAEIYHPMSRPKATLAKQAQRLVDSRGAFFPEFAQIKWDFHQILEFGGSYFDASLRFDKNNPPATQAVTNPDYYLNQRNVNDGIIRHSTTSLLSEIQSESDKRRVPLPDGFESRISSDYVGYQTSIGRPPEADHNVFRDGLPLNSYFERLFYLETRPDLRKVHGYGPKIQTQARSLVISLGKPKVGKGN